MRSPTSPVLRSLAPVSHSPPPPLSPPTALLSVPRLRKTPGAKYPLGQKSNHVRLLRTKMSRSGNNLSLVPAGIALAADIRGRYGSGVSFETNSVRAFFTSMILFLRHSRPQDAQACVTDGVVLAAGTQYFVFLLIRGHYIYRSLSRPNECRTNIDRADGAVVGPSGTISFTVRTGFFSSTSYTVKSAFSVYLWHAHI